MNINEYRENQDLWHGIAYLESITEERACFDKNSDIRYELLLKLQYDRKDSDYSLIRYAFEQQIISLENNSIQGSNNSLTLCAFLLARYKRETDIALFYRAKNANFDTFCGFDINFMYVALGEETNDYLETNHPTIYTELKERYHISSEDLKQWWVQMQKNYPDNIEEEDLFDLYDRFRSLGDNESALIYLEKWKDSQGDTNEIASTLKYCYQDLGLYDKAIDIQKSIYSQTHDYWDKASKLDSLVELYRQAGQFDKAYETILQLNDLFQSFDDWKNIGLGKRSVHEAFELALASDDSDIAKKIFDIAKTWHAQTEISPIALQVAYQAAEKHDLKEDYKYYQRLSELEQQAIEAIFNQLDVE